MTTTDNEAPTEELCQPAATIFDLKAALSSLLRKQEEAADMQRVLLELEEQYAEQEQKAGELIAVLKSTGALPADDTFYLSYRYGEVMELSYEAHPALGDGSAIYSLAIKHIKVL